MCGIHPKVQKYGNQIMDEVKLGKKLTTHFKGYKLIINDFKIDINKPILENNKVLDQVILKASKSVYNKNYYGTLIVPENINFSSKGRFLLFYYTNKIISDIIEITKRCGCSGYNYLKDFKEYKGVGELQLPNIKIINFIKEN